MGEEIPIEGRITAVAAVFDALLSVTSTGRSRSADDLHFFAEEAFRSSNARRLTSAACCVDGLAAGAIAPASKYRSSEAAHPKERYR
jgi:hypothetical protein